MMYHSRARPMLSLSILILTTLLQQSIAFIRPEEGSDWEDVHSYRRRLGQHFGYQTRMLSPEVCRHTTEKHCQQMDEQFAELANANRRYLQSGPVTFKVLVLLVQFADHTDRTRIDRDIFDRMWNADDTDSTYYPTGSIKTYYQKNSYGRLNVEATVVDWQTLAETEAYYADGNRGLPSRNAPAKIIEGIIPVLDSLDADDSFDFFQFDNDQRNSNVDVTILMHSGYAAERGNNEACNELDFTQRIQSFAQAYNPGIWRSSRTGMELGSYVTASAYRGTCDFNIARMGVTVHEFIHTFGIPDLYDLGGALNPGSVGGIGGYDTMANPGGQSGRQAYPGYLSPWTKMKLGWLTPIEITVDGTYVATPSATTEVAYMIAAPYAAGEYFLIENRQPIDYDLFIRNWRTFGGQSFEGGILIYHIDDEVNAYLGTPANGFPTPPGDGNLFRGFPGQDGWPGNFNHYQVALLQADGLYEQEKSLNNGHWIDFWREGTSLGPGNGELVATSQGTYPNTDSYSHKNGIRVTGLTIDNFQLAADGAWQFDVNGLSAVGDPPTDPPTTNAPTKNPTRMPTTQAPTRNPTRAPQDTPTIRPTPTATNNPAGCCSRNYRDCNAASACGATKEACENCAEDRTVLWLERGAEEVGSCVPRFVSCNLAPADCCGPVGALSCSLEAGSASSVNDADRHCYADADLIQSRRPTTSPAPSNTEPSPSPVATPPGQTTSPVVQPTLSPITNNPVALSTTAPAPSTDAPTISETTGGASQRAQTGGDSDGLSSGAIAGIVIGLLVIIAAGCYLCAVVLLRRRGE